LNPELDKGKKYPLSLMEFSETVPFGLVVLLETIKRPHLNYGVISCYGNKGKMPSGQSGCKQYEGGGMGWQHLRGCG
jgi:hypothetical protein